MDWSLDWIAGLTITLATVGLILHVILWRLDMGDWFDAAPKDDPPSCPLLDRLDDGGPDRLDGSR